MADIIFCSHYPFTTDAKNYAKEKQFKITDDTIEGGAQRIIQALSKEGEILTPATYLDTELENQIIYYAASRMILSAFRNRYCIRRMAVAESKLASKYLSLSHDKTSGYDTRLSKSLNLDFIKDAKKYKLAFWQYLKNCPRDVHYKLTNMELSNGFVSLREQQKNRIIEEAIRHKLEDESSFATIKNPIFSINSAIEKIKPLIPKETLAPTKINSVDFAPCIKKMLDDLRMSVNIGHSGRLALAIYLIKAGLSDEKIQKIFTTAPDYDPTTTSYQIKYIRDKQYSMPSCATMYSNGLCVATCRCNNPINFKSAIHSKFIRKEVENQ